MALRISKIILLAAVGFFFFVVFLNNGILDYRGNYEYTRHVLSMDTTGANNPHIWRAIRPTGPDAANHWIYHVFYLTIIACETTTCLLCSLGAVRLWKARKSSGDAFNEAKSLAIYGLILSLLQWFTITLTIGGEWFYMFLSKDWDAQGSAFRMFTCIGVVLIYLSLKNEDLKPVS